MRHFHAKHHWPWLLVGAVALLVRLKILLTMGTLWHDEAFTRRFALKPLGEMLSLLKFDVHPPLHAALAHFWLMLGDDARLLRGLSLITAVFGLFVFARLGEILTSRKAAFLAFALAALSPLMAYYGADGRMYALIFLLSCASSLYFWKFAQGDDTAKTPWFVLSLALALTHVTGALVLGAQFLWLLRTAERRARLVRLVIGFLLIGSAFATWLIPAAAERLATAGSEWQFSPAGDGLPAPLALVYWVWLGRGTAALAVVFALTALCIVAAVMRRSEHRPFFRVSAEGEYLLLWLGCGFLPFLLMPFAAPRYLMAAIPAFFLLVAAGFLNAGGNRNHTLALGVAGIVVISFAGLFALTTGRSYNWDKDVDWISARWQPGDRVVFGWYADEMAFEATEVKPFARDVAAFGELRGLYPYDDTRTFDQRLVAHAGTISLRPEDIDRLGPLMGDGRRVFFMPNEGLKLAGGTSSTATGTSGNANDAVNAWFLAHGWYLLDHHDAEGRTQGVWLMVRK